MTIEEAAKSLHAHLGGYEAQDLKRGWLQAVGIGGAMIFVYTLRKRHPPVPDRWEGFMVDVIHVGKVQPAKEQQWTETAPAAVKVATGAAATKSPSHNEVGDRKLTARNMKTGNVGRAFYIGPVFKGRDGVKTNDVLYRVVMVHCHQPPFIRRWKIGRKQIQIVENGEVIDTL